MPFGRWWRRAASTAAEREDAPSAEQPIPDARTSGRIRRVLISPRRVHQLFVDREWLLIVCAVVFLMASGLGVVSPVLPIYARTYDISTTLVGLLLSVFGIGRIVMGIPAGQVADRRGPRSLLILGPAVMAVGSLGVALSGNYILLLIFRFVQGVGSGIQMTGGYLAIADLSPKGQVGKMTGLYQSSLVLGISAGPVIGGLLAEEFGFRSPFVAQGVLAGLAAIWAWRRFPRIPHRSQASHHRGMGAVRSRIGALLLNRNFLLISLVSFAVFFSRGGTRQTLLPLLGHDGVGLSVATVGTVYSVITLFDFVALAMAGSLSDRFGRKATIVPSLVLGGIAFVTIGQTYSLFPFLLGGILLGLATGLGGPAPAAYVSDIAPAETYGLSFGIFRTMSDTGLILGPLLAGWLADLWGLRVPFYVTGVGMIAVGLSFAFFATDVRPLEQKRDVSGGE